MHGLNTIRKLNAETDEQKKARLEQERLTCRRCGRKRTEHYTLASNDHDPFSIGVLVCPTAIFQSIQDLEEGREY